MTTVHHRTITVHGLEVFYREAGPKEAPVMLLLHGYPTSSHMFRHLVPALARRYRVIAPGHLLSGLVRAVAAKPISETGLRRDARFRAQIAPRLRSGSPHRPPARSHPA